MFFFLLAAGLAIYGVYKRGALTVNKKSVVKEEQEKTSLLWKKAIPALALLIMVIAGSRINSLIGITIFTPVTAVIFTSILTVIFTPLNTNDTSEALVDGSKFILTTLFSVGIFLGFINIIAELGTFEQLAAIAGNAPQTIIVPVAMIIAFLIAIPAGAFCAGVLTLVLPTLAVLGLPSEAMGLVAIAAGLGTQVSPVQINVAALAKGFELEIIDVIKGNVKYILGSLVLLILISIVLI